MQGNRIGEKSDGTIEHDDPLPQQTRENVIGSFTPALKTYWEWADVILVWCGPSAR